MHIDKYVVNNIGTKWTDGKSKKMDLAKNCGRRFTPPEAHSLQQPTIDLGDVEFLDHKYNDNPEEEDGYQEVQVGGSGN